MKAGRMLILTVCALAVAAAMPAGPVGSPMGSWRGADEPQELLLDASTEEAAAESSLARETRGHVDGVADGLGFLAKHAANRAQVASFFDTACGMESNGDPLKWNACVLDLHVALRNLAHDRGVLPLDGYPGNRTRSAGLERVYIEGWLQEQQSKIPRGSRCVEFGSPGYINKFFGDRCEHVHYFVTFDEGVMQGRNSHVKELTTELQVDVDQGTGPVPLGSMDVIVCTQVFEHLRNPHSAIRNLYKMLRPGGTILFTVPSTWPYHTDSFGNYFLYTHEGVQVILKDAGFHIEELRCHGDSWLLATESEGLGWEELSAKDTQGSDCGNPIHILARATKPRATTSKGLRGRRESSAKVAHGQQAHQTHQSSVQKKLLDLVRMMDHVEKEVKETLP